MDVCVGNLVTVVEEVDFRAVAAWPGSFDAGIFAMGNREGARLNHAPIFDGGARLRARK